MLNLLRKKKTPQKLTKRCICVFKVLLVNETVSVLINKCESLHQRQRVVAISQFD